MQYYKLKPLVITMGACLIASIFTGCAGGSGGATTDGGDPSGGGSSTLNIKPVSKLTSLLNATYTASCTYRYGNTAYLINSDGSGTGVALDLGTGQVSQLTNLAKINMANGDACLPNYQQLTWINKSNPYVINVFDPNSNTTQAVDLSQTGVSGSSISATSFTYDPILNQLYANSRFANDGQTGFARFNLSESPVTTINQLDNSLYQQYTRQAVFGFWGTGSEFSQLFTADSANNLPAALVNVISSGQTPPQTVHTITDSNYKAIPAMDLAWDMAFDNKGNFLNAVVIVVKS